MRRRRAAGRVEGGTHAIFMLPNEARYGYIHTYRYGCMTHAIFLLPSEARYDAKVQSQPKDPPSLKSS